MAWIKNWFSNFQPFEVPLRYDQYVFTTPEHFYQAMKSEKHGYRLMVSFMGVPGQAKKAGNKVELRPDWEDIKLDVMEAALRYKFQPGTKWHDQLMSTTEDIVERNNWHDNFWGDCECDRCNDAPGLNHLGELLMKIREEFRTGNAPPPWWLE